MNYKNIKEAVKEEIKEHKVSLWGDKLTFTPVLASSKLGNGKKLVALISLDQRPQYWLIRIDNNMSIDDDHFDIEKLIDIIEEEFGRINEEEFYENSYIATPEFYPRIYWSGGSCEEIYCTVKINFKEGGI